MEEKIVKSHIMVCSSNELSPVEHSLIDNAVEATTRSYARYSNFKVGAAVLLDNGSVVVGCNHENASFPAGICAERSALYAAASSYPDSAPKMLAIAAKGTDGKLLEEPILPCGICRQVIVETETRFDCKLHILLYGQKYIYIIDGIENLMPLSFTKL